MTELILFDLKGVICQKVNHKPSEGGLKLSSYYVVFRPHLEELLNFCYSHYRVGFFTSTSKKNAKLIIDKILTPEQAKVTELKWARGKTRYDPDEKNGFKTIKLLKDLFENPKYNEGRKWNEKNVLLIDDSEEKTRFNNPKNVLIVDPYNAEKSDKVLRELMEQIPIKIMKMKAQ